MAASGDQRRRTQAATDAQVEASSHQRALNAEDALKAAYTEIDIQRERIGASSSANSATCKPSTPKAPLNASPPRTPN